MALTDRPRETPSGPSITPPSQRDRAYGELRRLLLLQRIPEGVRLREPEWSRKLEVNRVALREAFARLEAEGLLQKGPKTGYFVPVLTQTDIEDILELRTALEFAAIERICSSGRASDFVLNELRQLCEELEVFIRSGYLLGAGEADRRFHERLVSLAGNPHLERMFRIAPLPMLHGHILDSAGWEPELKRTLNEHRSIVEALSSGRVQLAQKRLKNHLHGPYLQSFKKTSTSSSI